MKLTTLLLIAIVMQISAKTHAQRISLSVKNQELTDVFDQITRQTGYSFVFTNSILKNTKKITLQVNNIELTEVLEQIFENQPIDYSINQKVILLKRQERNLKQKIIAEFLSFDVRGKVTDEKGIGLPGATISVKGTKNRTSSNENGDFVLKNVEEGAVITVSSLGYKTVELAAAANLGNISLNIAIGELKEVAISTGYQTLPKERVTGSFSTLSAKKLEEQRLSSLGSLLEGRIPGYNRGLIRGTTSMNATITPLYVIDGFPVESTNIGSFGGTTSGIPGLNLEDIESISVLKDAAAASIYGAQAANGVVVIVTKKGKIGKPQISASSTITHTPYRIYTDNLTNAADIIDIEREWANNNPNLQGPDAAAYAANLLENNAYPSQGINAILRNYAGTLSDAALDAKLSELSSGGYQYYRDVERYTKRDPFYQQYNLNVGTASETNSFYSSVTYRNNRLEDKYAGDESIGINLNNSTKIAKWLTMDLSSYFSYGEVKTQPNTALSPGYTYQPYDRLVNPDGSFYTSSAASRLSANTMSVISDNGLYNMDITPLEELGYNLGKSRNFNNRSSIKLNARITDWLSYNPSFQYEFTNRRSNTLYNKNSIYVRSLVNSFTTANTGGGTAVFNLPYGDIDYTDVSFSSAYNFRQQINIDKQFGEKHNLTAIAGTEIRNTKAEFQSNYMYNYDSQLLSSLPVNEELLSAFPGGLLGSATFNRGRKNQSIDRFISLYANAGYTYDDQYLLTASIRWDRSNLWATSSKYQDKPIWSLGAGWNIHKAPFFNADWVNILKLRASRGIAGNVDRNSAPYLVGTYFPNYNVGGLQGSVGQRPNPLLSWEKTTTNNIGVDFSMFDNRINGSADYYHKSGTDLLANTTGVPTEGFGYSTYTMNNGKMVNKGFEFNLSGNIIKNSSLNWNLSVQYALNKNKVTYVNVEAPLYVFQLDLPQAYPRIGNPYNSIYGYKWAGLNENGIAQVYNENGEKFIYSPGTLESIVYNGTDVPKYSGSVNNLLEYKNFSFSFLLTFEGGHKMKNTFLPVLGNSYNGNVGGYITTIAPGNKDIVNRWKNPGDEGRTNIPKAVFAEDPDFNSDNLEIYRYSDINVIDGTNLRMRNISLAYKIPLNWVNKLGLSNARFQFNMENAFTIAKNKTAKYLMDGYSRPNYVWGMYLNF